MKKLFIIILALAMSAACSKTEVQYEPTGEIVISPVNSNLTKSMMESGEFLGESFNVWAWYNPVSAMDNATTAFMAGFDDNETTLYINEKPFVPKGDPQDNKWGGKVSYFWPKLGSLVFAGYYAPKLTDGTNGTEDQVTYTFNRSQNVMTFNNVKQTKVVPPTTVNGEESKTFEEDIMYFNMTPASYNHANNSVNLPFKHALSWITVTLAKGVEPKIDAKIIVKRVWFSQVAEEGDGNVIGASDIVWTPDADSKKECNVLNDDFVVDYSTDSNGEVSSRVYKLDEYLFIPQNIDGWLNITYVVESTDQSAFTETYSIRLASLKGEAAHNKWEPAKHYTYSLTIGTDEIKVNPTVETWGDKNTPVSIPLPEDLYDNLENNNN